METLGDERATLRAFLLKATASNGDKPSSAAVEAALYGVHSREFKRFLQQTIVYHYYRKAAAYPRTQWSPSCSLTLSEAIALVIERLLTRRRHDADESNLLTLGYREVAPGSNGHRVTSTNSVMCYYPNTLVATLKTPLWEQLHQLIGDDLLVHLLLNYSVFVKVPGPVSSYIQLTGTSLRWMKASSRTFLPPVQSSSSVSRKRKRSPHESLASTRSKKEPAKVVSINQVMYARHFQKRSVFAKSELALGAARCADDTAGVSRGNASTVIRSMFPEVKNEKRLPKRLVNLVPIVQDVVRRYRQCDLEATIDKLLPAPVGLRDFMLQHRNIQHALTATREGVEPASDAAPPSLLCRINEDGYVSQQESPMSKQNRKRKRREGAIEAISSVSTAENTEQRTKKRVRFLKEETQPTNEVEPMLGVDQLAQLQRHRSEISELLQFSVPKKHVQRIVLRVLAMILPKELWGKTGNCNRSTCTNWTRVKTFVKRLIEAKKYDMLSLDVLAASFRVKDITWMNASGKSSCPPTELRKRQEMVASLVYWASENVVFPLLRNCFYITECEGSANEVFYYPRRVWTIISSLALYDLSSFILRPIPPSESSLASRQLASSRLRLLPKMNGVRPLLNLSGKGPGVTKSVNKSLELVHRALLFEIERHGDRLLSATVRNMDEIYAKIKALFRSVDRCSHCNDGNQPKQLYCVAVDVERCFDTIRPKKLLRILKKLFVEEEYLVRKHWVCKGEHFKMERPAFPSGDLKGFDQLVAETGKKRDSVFVDGVLYDYVTKATILKLLREHLTANTVQANDQTFVQRQGIPQGSVLSTTLCNLYYANFERRVLLKQLDSGVSDRKPTCARCSHELLMRYTDDFFFVSTDINKARQFAQLMHRGNEDYGCFVNATKSRVNFDVAVVDGDGNMGAIPRFDRPGHQNATAESDEVAHIGLLAWCGLLIDPVLRQIYVNYDKLSLSVVAASIPVDDSKSIGAVFVNKVLSAIRQRWHRLYFDFELLLPSTVQINLYQLLCLAALRFVLLVDKLPSSLSPSFLHGCITAILIKTSRGIQRTLTGLPKPHLAWLDYQVWRIGLLSFQVVVKATKLNQTTRGQQQSSGPTVDWQVVIKSLAQDTKRMANGPALPPPFESNGGRGLQHFNETTLSAESTVDNGLPHHPQNAVVRRWLAAYGARGRGSQQH